MTLWQKDGGAPQELPVDDVDAEGYIRTHLEEDPEARALCGWVEAPAQPTFDPATQQCVWVDGAWTVQALSAPPAVRMIARIDFVRRFTVTELARIQVSADPLVKNFLFMLTIVEAVDLDNADTQNSVHYLEAESMLDGTGRSAIILG